MEPENDEILGFKPSFPSETQNQLVEEKHHVQEKLHHGHSSLVLAIQLSEKDFFVQLCYGLSEEKLSSLDVC